MTQNLIISSDNVKGCNQELKISISGEVDIVSFGIGTESSASFTKQEAIDICRVLTKLLDADICN